MEPDDFERRYMGADEALAISRARLGLSWHLFFIISTLNGFALMGLSTLAPGLHALAWAGGFVAFMMAAIWLTAMVVRVVVTPAEVRIRHGLFGPSIALDDIVSVHADRHGLKRFLLGIGWGVGGKSLDGSYLFSTLGVPRGLVIRYRTKSGIAESFVSSDDPEALIAAIDRARTHTRIAPVAAQPEAELDEALEEEAEQSGESARGRATR